MSIYLLDYPKKIEELYALWPETMIASYLQGCMGQAFVDDLKEPQSAQILIADFCFFAGEPHQELVENIKSPLTILVPQNQAWVKCIETVYGQQIHKRERYATLKEKEVFDRQQLEHIVRQLPHDYEMRPINQDIYNQVLKEKWSQDFCIHFHDYDDYQHHGIGFVILYKNEIVAGASSYTYYQDGIEIEIDTRKDHRRKGLAKCCAAQLILECLERDLYPSWDAHNQKSLCLSYQLGYHFDKSYDVYEFIK